jgi:hypothetical protein
MKPAPPVTMNKRNLLERIVAKGETRSSIGLFEIQIESNASLTWIATQAGRYMPAIS